MKLTVLIYITLLFQLTDIISAGFLECSTESDCKAENSVCTENICYCPVGQVFNLDGTKCLPLAIGMEADCEDDAQCDWLLGKHRCNERKCDCEVGWRYYEGQCIKAAGFNETCSADQDCYNNYDILAMVCKENVCECNDGYYLRGNYDCRPEATKFDDYCSLDSDCKMNDSACIGSYCVNITENAYLGNRLHQDENFPVIKIVTQGYADIDCDSNTDCTSLKDSICYTLTKKCICKRGYFLTEAGCVAELGVDVGCRIDNQCTIAPGICINRKCYCRPTYFYSKSNRACQKPMTHDNLFCNNDERCYVYGTEVTCLTQQCKCRLGTALDDDSVCRIVTDPGTGGCNNDGDCTTIINSICGADAKCVCPPNCRLEGNTCLPNIGGACDTNGTKPCEMENTVCGNNNICTCIPNHVPNGITNCLKVSSGLDDQCEIDAQCTEVVKDSKCTENTCQCIDNYTPVNGTCYAQKCTDIISAGFLECSKDSDCKAENSACTENICYCPVGQVFNLDGTKCLPLVIGMEADCEDDAQCAWLLGKHRCNERKCDCEVGWRYYEGQCIKAAGFNETCSADQDCYNNYDILAMVCKENVCECNDGYYLRGNYDCRPAATKFNDYCSLDSDCKMNDSACIGSYCVNITENAYLGNRLHPDENFPVIKHVTQGYADIDCESNNDCTSLKDSICYTLTKKCICNRGYFLTEAGCVAELGVDVGCRTDNQCTIAPGRCINRKCYCRPTYFYSKSNRACQKPMTHDNLFCNNDERCYVYGTEVTCLNQQCRCRLGAALDDDSVCRIVTDPGTGGCNNDGDCTTIINSICGEDAKCVCPPNCRLEDNTCLPNIGGACDINGTKPCEMENTVCGNNNICTCIPNHVPNGITNCLKVSSGLDDQCEIDTQCTEVVKDSKCTENTCQCIDNYTSVNGTCYAQKFMGDICTKSTDCHIMLGSNVQCRNGLCQCSADMQLSTDGRDCHSSASAIFLQMNSLLFVTFCYLTIKFSM